MTRALRSRRGASLTMALLLFLVCAVVGGVVLAAASAAAGRAANPGGFSGVNAEQKYYSVTSAAGLLEEELEGRWVKVIRTREIIKKTVSVTRVTEVVSGYSEVSDGAGGTITIPVTTTITESDPDVVTYAAVYTTQVLTGVGSESFVIFGQVPGGSDTSLRTETGEKNSLTELFSSNTGNVIPLNGLDFITEQALKLLFGTNESKQVVCDTEEAWNASFLDYTGSDGRTGEFTMTPAGDALSAAGIEGTPLNIRGRWETDASDGALKLTFWNDDGDAVNTYALELSAEAGITSDYKAGKQSTTTKYEQEKIGDTVRYTETKVVRAAPDGSARKTDTRTDIITWTCGGVAGASAPAAG